MVYLAARLGLPAWLCEPWRFATLLLCCIISYMTWRAIEVPMIEFGNRLADNSPLKPSTKPVA
jgi:peptidoglycan/LPS O-acetylase OafA/YrhL